MNRTLARVTLADRALRPHQRLVMLTLCHLCPSDSDKLRTTSRYLAWLCNMSPRAIGYSIQMLERLGYITRFQPYRSCPTEYTLHPHRSR